MVDNVDRSTQYLTDGAEFVAAVIPQHEQAVLDLIDEFDRGPTLARLSVINSTRGIVAKLSYSPELCSIPHYICVSHDVCR